MATRHVITPGQKFTRLTVIREIEARKSGKTKHRRILCVCECGKEFPVYLENLVRKLKPTRSCGCLCGDRGRLQFKTHGESNTRLYRNWDCMIQRIRNPNSVGFVHYGGRGITICPEWSNFPAFRDWALENGYKAGLTIERKNVNGNYEPDNCTWIPKAEQARNKRQSRRFTVNGETRCLAVWARRYGVNYYTLWSRLQRGWAFEDAVINPPQTVPAQ